MISFDYLNKTDFLVFARQIFDILADNMTVIAPTCNSREEDFNLWSDAVSDGLQKPERQIILIRDNETIIGFFQYYTNADTFMMEEIQFENRYQGKGIFRKLFGFLIENIDDNIKFVEAYANCQNQKSTGILNKMGLVKIGTNKNGHSFHFKGSYEDLFEWYNGSR